VIPLLHEKSQRVVVVSHDENFLVVVDDGEDDGEDDGAGAGVVEPLVILLFSEGAAVHDGKIR